MQQVLNDGGPADYEEPGIELCLQQQFGQHGTYPRDSTTAATNDHGPSLSLGFRLIPTAYELQNTTAHPNIEARTYMGLPLTRTACSCRATEDCAYTWILQLLNKHPWNAMSCAGAKVQITSGWDLMARKLFKAQFNKTIHLQHLCHRDCLACQLYMSHDT